MTPPELPRQGQDGYGSGGSGERLTSIMEDRYNCLIRAQGGKKTDAYNQLMIPPIHRMYGRYSIHRDGTEETEK